MREDRCLPIIVIVLLFLAGLFGAVDAGVDLDSQTVSSEIFHSPSTRSFASGDGSLSDPYQISDVTQLQAMRDDLNAHYVLVNDIDASETATWNFNGTDYEGFEPVGRDLDMDSDFFQGDEFMGTFDGSGYKIINLQINRLGEWFVGLFGMTGSGSRLKNVVFQDAEIRGYLFIGPFAGGNNGTISDCRSNGTVIGSGYLGGCIGSNSGRIERCNSSIAVSGMAMVGGICGENYGDIVSCNSSCELGYRNTLGGITGSCYCGKILRSHSTGKIVGENFLGGLVGNLQESEIFDSSSDMNVDGMDEIGGLVGICYDSSITRSYSKGQVSGNEKVGSFVGSTYSTTINQCYSNGQTTGNRFVGGFVGKNNHSTIENSYSMGYVEGNRFVGGFVGYADGSFIHPDYIKKCYSATIVTCNSDVGGFAGKKAKGAHIFYCFWDIDVSGINTSDGGSGNSTSELKTKNTYLDEDWDFDNIWDIEESSTYPYLQWENSPESFILKIITQNEETAYEDVSYHVHYSTNHDRDENQWTLSTDADWLMFDDNLLLLFGTPNNSNVGVFQVTISVDDKFGNDAQISFPITVVNNPPEILTTNPLKSINISDEYNFDCNSDDDGQGNVTWSLDTNANWLVLDAETGSLNGVPSHSDGGVYSVNVTVSDGNGGIDWLNWTIDVVEEIELNIISSPFEDAIEDVPYEYQVNVTSGYVVENPSGVLAFSLEDSPDNMTIDTETGQISWTPVNEQADMDHQVNVRVADGALKAYQEFMLHVENVNDPPQMVDISPPTIALEGDIYSYPLTAIDDDPTMDTLTWNLKTNATWLEIDDTGLVSGTAEPGVFFVNVTVSDGNGGVDFHRFDLIVNSIPIMDSDGDGHPDAEDLFPDDPDEWADPDGDDVGNNSDAFPNDPAASLDSDADGYPDEWNEGKGETDSTTGLELDAFPSDSGKWAESSDGHQSDNNETDKDETDSDGDGVPDKNDPFPTDPAASVDSDSDGHPDTWNPGMGPEDSTSGLILDPDPNDPDDERTDDDDDPADLKNEQENKWILPAIAIAIIIVVVLVLLLFVFKKGKKPEIPQQESIPHSQRQRPNPKMQTQPVQMMPARSQPVKTAPVKTPVRATKPPTQTQVAVQMTKPIENQVDWEDDLYGGL